MNLDKYKPLAIGLLLGGAGGAIRGGLKGSMLGNVLGGAGVGGAIGGATSILSSMRPWARYESPLGKTLSGVRSQAIDYLGRPGVVAPHGLRMGYARWLAERGLDYVPAPHRFYDTAADLRSLGYKLRHGKIEGAMPQLQELVEVTKSPRLLAELRRELPALRRGDMSRARMLGYRLRRYAKKYSRVGDLAHRINRGYGMDYVNDPVVANILSAHRVRYGL